MDSEQHRKNIGTWLLDPLEIWCNLTGFTAFLGSNSFVYYGPRRKHDVVGPDLYVVNGGVNRGQPSWIVSQEGGLKPSLVMEFMSETTRDNDQTSKLILYRDVLCCRDYFLVDDGPSVRGFHLQGGLYVPIVPNVHGRLPCSSLPLEVGVSGGWVRWFEPNGQVLPTGRELAEAAQQRANLLALDLAAAQAELARLRGTSDGFLQ